MCILTVFPMSVAPKQIQKGTKKLFPSGQTTDLESGGKTTEKIRLCVALRHEAQIKHRETLPKQCSILLLNNIFLL